MAIEKLKVGMLALSQTAEGLLEYQPVSRTISSEKDGYLEVTFQNGQMIRVTPTHPFFDPVTQTYREIGTFREGDVVLHLEDASSTSSRSEWLRIDQIKAVAASVTVYNLTVEGNHNYFAEGVLVHNKGRAAQGGGCTPAGVGPCCGAFFSLCNSGCTNAGSYPCLP